MKNFFNTVIFLLMIFFSSPLSSLQSLAQSDIRQRNSNYELFFEDNFDGKDINSKAWSKIKRQTYSWSKYMSDNKSLYKQSRGRMRLYARHNKGIEPNDTATYLTGGISTQNKVTIKYGKVEVRARIKGAKGTWPAIWLLRTEPDKVWPNPEYAEIDILESEDRWSARQVAHCYHTMHLKKPVKNNVQERIDTEKYNIYTIEILPDMLIFSINNRETFRYNRIEGEEIGQYPFRTEYYLMLDMQVGGDTSWLPVPDPVTYPAYMDIDWVKMYKLKE